MNPQWQAFLEQHGATYDKQTGIRFSNANTELMAAESGLALVDLSHLGVISVTGTDAETFLQAQFANDVTQVTDQHCQLNAYCSPKGRVLAEFRLIKHSQGYYLVLPISTLASTLKRLSMFVMRSAVVLTDVSTSIVGIGLVGQGAAELLEAQLGGVPSEPNAVMHLGDSIVTCIPGSPERFQILAPVETQMETWKILTQHANSAGTAIWRALDIRAGLPEITAPLQDVWVPQMLNLQAVGGISFKKGCYPGQEIVARTQYLGKLKRRMFRAHMQGDTAPQPGDEVFSGGDSEQSSGRVVSVVGNTEHGFDMLAVLQISDAEDSRFYVGSPQGPQLQLLELPYSLDID